jgi:hypothetical protein
MQGDGILVCASKLKSPEPVGTCVPASPSGVGTHSTWHDCSAHCPFGTSTCHVCTQFSLVTLHMTEVSIVVVIEDIPLNFALSYDGILSLPAW